MEFVFFLDAAQNRNRICHAGLAHKYGLETPRQRGILFHMLPIFIKRRGANAMQFTARQGWLQQVGRIHRPIRLARADQCVHFINE